MKLTHNMRQALIDLDNPLCSASVYWSTSTMKALHARGLVDKRDNGITWSWELRPEGKAYLAASGTSGCAMCDDLKSENVALREKVEAWEWCNQVQRIYDNIAFVLGLRQCAINELYTTLTAAREAVHADRE